MLSTTLERSKKVLFTDSLRNSSADPAYQPSQVSPAKRKGDTLTALNSKGVKIGSCLEPSYVSFAKDDFYNAIINQYESWTLWTKDVLSGKILALLYDNIEVKTGTRQIPDAAIYLQTLIRTDRNDPLAMAVHWEDTHLNAWLNQYLKQIRIEGLLNQWITKYIEKDDWRNQ